MVNLGWCQQCGVQPNGMWGGLVGSVVSCGSTPMGWAAGLWGERSHTAVPQCGVWCCVWWTCGVSGVVQQHPNGVVRRARGVSGRRSHDRERLNRGAQVNVQLARWMLLRTNYVSFWTWKVTSSTRCTYPTLSDKDKRMVNFVTQKILGLSYQPVEAEHLQNLSML